MTAWISNTTDGTEDNCVWEEENKEDESSHSIKKNWVKRQVTFSKNGKKNCYA
jgi:hypothetical protein